MTLNVDWSSCGTVCFWEKKSWLNKTLHVKEIYLL